MVTVRAILIGGVVGGLVMAIGFLLLPDTPVYDALSMAAGLTAGFLTWRPAGQAPPFLPSPPFGSSRGSRSSEAAPASSFFGAGASFARALPVPPVRRRRTGSSQAP